MSVTLLDVNVLVEPVEPTHNDHEDAHHWFGRNKGAAGQPAQ
jgi:hypothetical protein